MAAQGVSLRPDVVLGTSRGIPAAFAARLVNSKGSGKFKGVGGKFKGVGSCSVENFN
jgi:hypothetical protein